MTALFKDAPFHLARIFFSDSSIVHDFWAIFYGKLCSTLNVNDISALNDCIELCLARSNNISMQSATKSIVEGMTRCDEQPYASTLPPETLSFAATSSACWYESAILLEGMFLRDNSPASLHALTSIYHSLGEYNFALAIKRVHSPNKSITAISSLLQSDSYGLAQALIEKAFEEAFSVNFPENDISFLETQWLECAKRLQQWDLIHEISKVDRLNENLMLVSGWNRLDFDIQSAPFTVSNTSEIVDDILYKHTPKIFSSLTELSDTYEAADKCHDSMVSFAQDLLERWKDLPSSKCPTHRYLILGCQQLTELQEFQSLFTGAASVGGFNRPQVMQELKGIFGTWRDRLPNKWDEESIWYPLVAWRNRFFSFLNKVLNTSPEGISSSANQQHSQPYASRGFHEIAWTVNRFAHVCRLNGFKDQALTLLSRIYTLPNIEVPEAFFKLREQAQMLHELC